MAERVLLKIVYLLTCRIPGLIVVLARGDEAATAEVLALGHDNAVLRRQVGRVRYEPADRYGLWRSVTSGGGTTLTAPPFGAAAGISSTSPGARIGAIWHRRIVFPRQDAHSWLLWRCS